MKNNNLLARNKSLIYNYYVEIIYLLKLLKNITQKINKQEYNKFNITDNWEYNYEFAFK